MTKNGKQESTSLCAHEDESHFEYSKERLHGYFQQECSKIQEQITRLEDSSLPPEKKQNAVDQILLGITSLSELVADTSNSITAYDKRAYSQAIKGLKEKLCETQTRTTPKAKFQFKTKFKSASMAAFGNGDRITAIEGSTKPVIETEESSPEKFSSIMGSPNFNTSLTQFNHSEDPNLPSKNYNQELAKENTGIRTPSFSSAKSIDISDHLDLHIILPLSASQATSSGTIFRLCRCVLDMTLPTVNNKPFASLVLGQIKSSLIIAGCVNGPTHITKAVDSIIVVASGQIRMHECVNVKMYVHCNTRPIIEDCSQIQFSSLPSVYTAVTHHSIKNQWDQVDDFKWLKSDQSPNWRKLPEKERINENFWEDVISGKMEIGSADILKHLGIHIC